MAVRLLEAGECKQEQEKVEKVEKVENEGEVEASEVNVQAI